MSKALYIFLGLVVLVAAAVLLRSEYFLMLLGVVLVSAVIVFSILLGMRVQSNTTTMVIKEVSKMQQSNDKLDGKQLELFTTIIQSIVKKMDTSSEQYIEGQYKQLPDVLDDNEDITWS